jgi:hypothetical protein
VAFVSLVGVFTVDGLEGVDGCRFVLLQGPPEMRVFFVSAVSLVRIPTITRECQGLPVLEVELGQPENLVGLPGPQADDVGELLGGEEHIQHTFEEDVLLGKFLVELLGFRAFPFVFVLELEDFFGGIFVFTSEFGEEFLHFLDFRFQAIVVFLHVGQLHLPFVPLLEQLLRELVGRDELLLQFLDFALQLLLLLFRQLR